MRLIERRDTPLVAALLVGTVVMFAQPLRFLLSVAESVSTTYGVDLVPGLFVFVLVFTVHYRTKHRDTLANLRLAARAAEEAHRNVADTTQLVSVSRAMANALEFDTLRSIILRDVPAIIGDRSVCLGISAATGWKWVVEPRGGSAAALADAGRNLLDGAETGASFHDWHVVPLHCAGRRLGMFGVHADSEVSALEVSRIEALCAVLSVSVKNIQLFDEMRMSSISDALTGCFNKSHACATLDAELRRSRRTLSPLSIVMFDIDGFKRVNDEHGHVSGDRMLAAVGETLRRTLRTSDIKCRYGGDEFLAILPDTPAEAAGHVAEHLRRAIADIEIGGGPGAPLQCHVSMGVATATPGELDATTLIQHADEELYRDKARNHGLRLVASPGELGTRTSG